MIKKFIDVYDSIEAKVLVASLAATVLIIFAQILMREFFTALSWSEELARYIFIWQIWLGMSIGLRDNKHIAVEILYNYVKGNPSKILKIIVSCLCIFICGFLVWYGWKLSYNAYYKNSLSAAMRMPLWIVYLALPFSSFVTGIRYILQLASQIKNFNSPTNSEGAN